MSLTPGTRLDNYEILSRIGAGGMGEVYRARDVTLARDVAFKVLPDAFATDADRLVRFRREAQLLASLNHPNIAHIYGLVDSAGTRAIAMELVEGETLQARLGRGALPHDEALRIATQVAEALEAAHERGIIHRDLKPGNIMLDAQGNVKVLDFGLAKALDANDSSANISNSPTLLSTAHTGAQVLIGTAPYISPEQIRGHGADARSDIWAFGCVLYELLTAKQAFTGETISDVIGGVLRIEPDWNALPQSTPPPIRTVIKRCLQKDRRRRFHAIADVRIELEEPAHSVTAPTRSPRIAWALAAVFGLAAILLSIRPIFFSRAITHAVAARVSIPFPAGAVALLAVTSAPFPAVSPDGQYVAFVAEAKGAQGVSRLWLRPIGSLTAQALDGTEGAGSYPFWSADSKFIGFFAGGKLKKVALSGGQPAVLCAGTGQGGTWNKDDVILFVQDGVLHRVSAAGGISTEVRRADKSKKEQRLDWPWFLPDGRHFLYLAITSEAARNFVIGSLSASNEQSGGELRVGSLDDKNQKTLFATNSRTLYADNHLLFVKDGTLMAQPFNAASLSPAGNLFPVAEKVVSGGTGNAAFGVSDNGTIVYQGLPVFTGTELAWFDRTGKKISSDVITGSVTEPSLSLDQTRLAVARSIDGGGTRNIWLFDLKRQTQSRITFENADVAFPVLSPDGEKLVYVSDKAGTRNLYAKSTSGIGNEELLLKESDGATDWSPDGNTILYRPLGIFDIWALPLTGDRKPFVVLNQPYMENAAKFSPDGRWFLYISNENGRNEAYVQSFPPTGSKFQISTNGALRANWPAKAKEIIVLTPDMKMMTVDVKLGPKLEVGLPRELFQVTGSIVGNRIAVSPDAQRFLIPLSAESSDHNLTAIINWSADSKASQ
jgi:dipeptidyl aminopeptidase/acylaminoacyl peptidase